MGQGQEVHARHLLNQCMQDGGWLLLQNCHLGLEFLNELMDTITTKECVNEDFRTWITTEAHPEFPINLLQSSIKFTNEPPQGRNDFLSHLPSSPRERSLLVQEGWAESNAGFTVQLPEAASLGHH